MDRASYTERAASAVAEACRDWMAGASDECLVDYVLWRVEEAEEDGELSAEEAAGARSAVSGDG